MNPLVRCPHCGRYHQATLEYCPDTGLPIYISTKPEPKHDSKILVWLAVAAGILVLIACLLLAIFVLPRFLSGNFSPGQQEPVMVPSLTLAPLETRFAENNTPVPTATEAQIIETMTPIPSVTPAKWDACPGFEYQSQLRTGMQAQIALDPPLPNRVRMQPSTSGTIVGYINPGGRVEILEGPTCEEGWIWWKVREMDTSLEGWTAEGDRNSYWVIPIP
jgi:hypothetical protein